MDSAITILPDGSPRLQCIKISTSLKPLVLINTYMPSEGSLDQTASYDSLLDEVYSVTELYSPLNTIIWAGDLNASFNRPKKTSNDRKFIEFCHEMKFHQPDSTPQQPTYHHFTGTTSSQIDHFLQLSFQKQIIGNIKIDTRHPLNCSTHDSITAIVYAQPSTKSTISNKGKPTCPRLKWEKVDKALYQELTKERLTCLEDTLDTPLPNNVLIHRIQDILLTSAQDAGPPASKKSHRKKPQWPPTIIPLIDASQEAHCKWVKKPNEINLKKCKAAKKKMRSAQRCVAAQRRDEHIANIMTACKNKSSNLFKLVKPKSYKTDVILDFGPDSQDQLEGWRSYFENLATPQVNQHFDPTYQRDRDFTLLLLQHLYSSENNSAFPHDCKSTTSLENNSAFPHQDFTTKLIQQLKYNKAADIYGITSEHIRLADHSVIKLLSSFIQNVYNSKQLPKAMKLGSVTPVVKKEKIATCPDSYRRITVTPVTGKLVEKCMLHDSRPPLNQRQNRMQRGFTEASSSSNAALLITEAIAEARDMKRPLFLQFLDARKAFDVVWHTGLLCSIHEQGVQGTTWQLFNDLYSDISSMVKWQGQLSSIFRDLQGLRQGGDTSADAFKCKQNPPLNKLEHCGEGFHIGITSVGAPTCADDTTLISSTLTGVNIMLAIAEKDASQQRYSFSTTKSRIMIANPNPATKEQLCLFQPTLCNEPIEPTTEEKHLGILRVPDNKCKATILSRIKTARRALFALTSAGVYGFNGLNPVASKEIIDVAILPMLTHSLDAMTPSDADIQLLESSYRTMLREIQHLPLNTAIPAIYLLLGALPLEGHLHLQTLSLYNRILNQTESAEFEIVARQLAMKDLASHSWTTHVRMILHKYNLPSAFTLLHQPRRKGQWKRQTKDAVRSYWNKHLLEEALSKVTLKFLSIHQCSIGIPHHSYNHSSTDPILAMMTQIKMKLLVQRYPLSSSYCAGKNRTQICPICQESPETIHHFLLECKPIHNSQDTYIPEIQAVLQSKNFLYPPLTATSYDWYTQLILDAKVLTNDIQVHSTIDLIGIQMIFKLHHRRSTAIGGGSRYSWARSRAKFGYDHLKIYVS